HNEHQQRAYEQLPIADHLADDVFQASVGDGPNQRSEKRAGATKERDNDGVGGAGWATHLRADKSKIDRIHRSSQSRGRVGDYESEKPYTKIIITKKLQFDFVDLRSQTTRSIEGIVEVFVER